MNSYMNTFDGTEGGLIGFARSYQRYGIFVNADGDIEYREWAPGAKELSLVN